jgi:hypothetical protein
MTELDAAYKKVLDDLKALRASFDNVIGYFERLQATEAFGREYEKKAYPLTQGDPYAQRGFCGLPE